jgi:DNA primase
MTIFEIIKQRVAILDVVRDYTALKRAGGYWKGRCPFHHEKTASFTVSPDRGIFYCFGCHVSGDVVSFIARAENLSGQRDAARLLAERHGIELPNDGIGAGPSVDEKERHFTIHELVAHWAQLQLKQYREPLAYISSRGFSPASLEKHTVGYFPRGVAPIKQLCVEVGKHNFLAQDLVDCNILAMSKNLYHTPFEDRILFPIKDSMGRISGFGGRIYRKDDTRPKYYNTKESEFFIKGSLLFGFDIAKKAIQEKQAAIIVEGYTDCLAMVQHGFLNTVATLGTACTQAHLKLLSRHADLLYVLYDADTAGTQAILRMTQLCWQVSMELKVVLLPSGTDPAAFLMAGGDLAERIAQAPDIFLFYIHTIGPTYLTAPLGRKLELIRQLLEAIGTIDDPLKRDLVLHQASQTLNLPPSVLVSELKRVRLTQATESVSTPQSAAPAPLGVTLLEKKLSCAILNRTDVLDARSIHYIIRYMPQPLSDYVRAVVALCDQGVKDPFKQFYAQQAPEVQQAVSALICSCEPELSEKGVYALFEQWQRLQWRRIVADIKEKIAEATIRQDTITVQNLVAEFNRLKQEMMTGV